MALNAMQQEAVNQTEGPLLILAGAGSGKTTVLVNRVQHIIGSGLAARGRCLPSHSPTRRQAKSAKGL